MKLKILTVMMAFQIILPFSIMGSPFCSEPSAPEPPEYYLVPSKPMVPFCVNQLTKTHTCSDWEIESYNSEVRRYKSAVNEYIWQLREYVDDAEDFLNDAVEYANCEIINLD